VPGKEERVYLTPARVPAGRRRGAALEVVVGDVSGGSRGDEDVDEV
jgi:hypothetical protein